MGESSNKVCADRKHLRIIARKFANTSLVGSQFFGSTTGKGGGEKGQNHILFTPEVRQFDFLAACVALGRNGEVRGNITHLQGRFAGVYTLSTNSSGESDC
jgi:hypothetical protein